MVYRTEMFVAFQKKCSKVKSRITGKFKQIQRHHVNQ
jgi:hypothetical protein